jgi:universal stress protein A
MGRLGNFRHASKTSADVWREPRRGYAALVPSTRQWLCTEDVTGDDVPDDQLVKPRQILVPTDLGEASEAAKVYGSMLAEGFGAALHILHVLPEGPHDAPGLDASRWAELMEHARRSAEERLEALLSPGERETLSVRTSVVFGRPVTKILEYAKDHGIDLIVIGSHGRTVVQQLWFGSVAQGVLLRAACPVVMVRPRHDGSPGARAAGA